jgi:hypothetical protein
MKFLKFSIAAAVVFLVAFSGVVSATHNEYRVAPTSFPEAAGAVRITVSVGCTNPRDTKFRTVDGTAISGRDYTAVSGQFAVSSATPRTFDLPVLNDNIDETDESIELILEGPPGNTQGGGGTDSQGACFGTPSKSVMLYIHDDEERSSGSAGATGPTGGTGPSPTATPAGGDEPVQSGGTPGALGPTVVATPDDAGSLEETTEQAQDSFVEFPGWAIGVAGLLVGAALVGLVWFWRQRQQPEPPA